MGPRPIKFTKARWYQATQLFRELWCTHLEEKGITHEPPARTHADGRENVVSRLEVGSISLVSQRIVRVRMTVIPIVSVGGHSGHPDRNTSDRIHNVSRDICPRRINTSGREVSAEWGRRHRSSIMLFEVKPHRARSDGTETQTTVRAWEGSFAGIGSSSTTALGRDGRLVNERGPASLGMTVGFGTLRGIGGMLERRARGRSRNGMRRTETRPHRM